MSYHGNLEIGRPSDALFKLHRNEQLKLLKIVHSRLPTSEFAFLSACHTAELTEEESIADEGLHLTSALQCRGFRSVVRTMWAMADTDGRDMTLACVWVSALWKCRGIALLEISRGIERPCEGAAEHELCVTPERWVNSVHCGA